MSATLSVSNLAWRTFDVATDAARLRDRGIEGLEVAPTKVWSEWDAPARSVSAWAARLRDEGIRVSGIQSLLFGRPDLQVLDRSTWPALRAQLARAFALGVGLGADVAVLGSPRNRLRGDLDEATALELAAEFLGSCTRSLRDHGLVLTLEPNAASYGADFLRTYDDVRRLARMVDDPTIRPQIDTGCLCLEGVDPIASLLSEVPAHIHVSAPGLAPPDDSLLDVPGLLAALRSTGYQGWLTLEMLPDDRTEATVDWFASALAGARS